MKNQRSQSKKNKFFLLISLVVGIFLAASYTVVVASDVSLSARIVDSEAPSVPILIEPSDGALLSDNTPSFKWHKSTDNMGLSHYVFYLNGSVKYDSIPLSDTNNSDYVLDYNASNGTYTLTPKSAITDGSHTWKVAAVDYSNLSAVSDTWDFTIDTLAPSFVLKKIGDTTVSISAADTSTVPDSAIIIFQNDATANEPILIANGEANSTVKLTVTIPDDTTQTFSSTINSDGYYELQLDILPRDVDIKLDFIITDQVGHVSVLEEVYFRIETQYWPTATSTVTVTPTTTTTGTVTATPTYEVSSQPTRPFGPSTSVVPGTSESPAPTGIIPIIPPKEVVHEASDELLELLPESTAEQVRSFLKSQLWKQLSLFLPLLLLLSFYFLAFLLLLSKFIRDISSKLLQELLLLLFPIIDHRQKHLVFEYQETLASPLVKVELLDQNQQMLDFTITNLQGNFADLSWPNDRKWFLQVADNNFYFPIGDDKPQQLSMWEFYQKQLMLSSDYHGQAILIPTLRAAGQQQLPFLERLRILVLYLAAYPWWFLILDLFFALIFALRYQSMFNTATLLFYVLILIYKLLVLANKKKSLILMTQLPGGQQFSDNLVLSLATEDGVGLKSAIIPFEFSRSKAINCSVEKISLCAFAKGFALGEGENVIGSQLFELNNKENLIDLKIQQI